MVSVVDLVGISGFSAVVKGGFRFRCDDVRWF